MKFFLTLTLFCALAINHVYGDGSHIVKAARSQIGVPYSWGGGGIHGKSKGIGEGANIVGFDCSGLAQYSIYQGTHKTIARTAAAQYNDNHCHHVAYGSHQPGDLVFFGNPIYHVGIVSAHGRMVNAPKPGTKVREENIWSYHISHVARCW
ncbi:peptidoglycan endopeptidase RipB [Dermatophagoides farinae]|uniref:Bacterial lytic enzyme n=1 Tax=Dermatophagoides farinae TaxID=6954 RepID=A0A411P9C6_DERFA|nr:peptidoglycan endopeptidase RipB-like [Dermatophagoides farinae]KAH7636559.1 hypothetical protein HUG17_10529 [Dermatophagoides farinae]KAH9528647.1 hypothetical protein DERF_002569 [Dermatophagoides farinae]QBF67840.1 bacterial lytic enzyme [Dermatophagoides farinae]QKU37018.1 bacterial lytic enzyme-like protein [Dermatophagoides farinae]